MLQQRGNAGWNLQPWPPKSKVPTNLRALVQEINTLLDEKRRGLGGRRTHPTAPEDVEKGKREEEGLPSQTQAT